MPSELRMSEALLQGLLSHMRRCRRERVPAETKLYPAGWLIGYRQLIEQSGVRMVAAWMTAPLSEIGQISRGKGWPDLPALVVNQAKGYPGPGYFKQPGAPLPEVVSEGELAAWVQRARCCMEPWPMPRGPVRWSRPVKAAGATEKRRRTK